MSVTFSREEAASVFWLARVAYQDAKRELKACRGLGCEAAVYRSDMRDAVMLRRRMLGAVEGVRRG